MRISLPSGMNKRFVRIYAYDLFYKRLCALYSFTNERNLKSSFLLTPELLEGYFYDNRISLSRIARNGSSETGLESIGTPQFKFPSGLITN
jgi:hypothetical protein